MVRRMKDVLKELKEEIARKELELKKMLEELDKRRERLTELFKEDIKLEVKALRDAYEVKRKLDKGRRELEFMREKFISEMRKNLDEIGNINLMAEAKIEMILTKAVSEFFQEVHKTTQKIEFELNLIEETLTQVIKELSSQEGLELDVDEMVSRVLSRVKQKLKITNIETRKLIREKKDKLGINKQ